MKIMKSNQIDLENKVILPGCPRKARRGVGHRWPLTWVTQTRVTCDGQGTWDVQVRGDLANSEKAGIQSSATRSSLLDAVNFTLAFKTHI